MCLVCICLYLSRLYLYLSVFIVYVFVCIWCYLSVSDVFSVSRVYLYVCLYMYVSVFMSKYLHVSGNIMHVSELFFADDTEAAAKSLKHLVVGQHPAGCTQGIPGHVCQHFISQTVFHQLPCGGRILQTPAPSTRAMPLKRPSDSARRPPGLISAHQSVLMPSFSRFGVLELPQWSGSVRHCHSKQQSDSDQPVPKIQSKMLC